MDIVHPSEFKFATVHAIPNQSERVGIVLVDERPGYTGIYVKYTTGLYPAREVGRSDMEAHDKVCAAWTKTEQGTVEDRRTCLTTTVPTAKIVGEYGYKGHRLQVIETQPGKNVLYDIWEINSDGNDVAINEDQPITSKPTEADVMEWAEAYYG